MGSVYQREDSRFWWIAFINAQGKRQQHSSGKETEGEARELLACIEKQVAAERALGLTGPEVLTVRKYSGAWLEQRRARRIKSVNEDEDRLEHALPVIGHMRLEEVRPKHILALVRGLVAAGKLAPRTILHVYGVLRVMFSDAQIDELILATPCILKQRRNELPKKTDKDPAWRATAVFSRGEVEQLISDARIPEYRRVFYALEFLGCMRVNEAIPRRWRDWDPEAAPLGMMVIDTHYDVKARELLAGTKTGPRRDVPVHPTLAAILARWRLGGWRAYRGRHPGDEDLIVPSPYRGGVYLNSNSTLQRLHEDLALLGLRARRQHDARRTFISLARADGADKEILKWVTHGVPHGDIMDAYTSLPWAVLCGEVSRLNVRALDQKVVSLATRQATGQLQTTQD